MSLSIDLSTEVPIGERPGVSCGFRHVVDTWSKLEPDFFEIWEQWDTLHPDFAVRVPPATPIIEFAPVSDSHGVRSVMSDTQRADILVTQHWLRLIVWQSAMKHGNLANTSPVRSMTFRYPEDIAISLLNDLSSLPLDAIRVQGLGIVSLQSNETPPATVG
jgi:hypothetical protein